MQRSSYAYPAKFTPPKKESKQSKALSSNIKRFLAKKEEEEKQKALEEKKKKEVSIFLKFNHSLRAKFKYLENIFLAKNTLFLEILTSKKKSLEISLKLFLSEIFKNFR